MNSNGEKLVAAINAELDNNCDQRVYPQVCERISHKRSRNELIKSIVLFIVKEGGSISGAIAQIEQELQDSN